MEKKVVFDGIMNEKADIINTFVGNWGDVDDTLSYELLYDIINGRYAGHFPLHLTVTDVCTYPSHSSMSIEPLDGFYPVDSYDYSYRDVTPDECFTNYQPGKIGSQR